MCQYKSPNPCRWNLLLRLNKQLSNPFLHTPNHRVKSPPTELSLSKCLQLSSRLCWAIFSSSMLHSWHLIIAMMRFFLWNSSARWCCPCTCFFAFEVLACWWETNWCWLDMDMSVRFNMPYFTEKYGMRPERSVLDCLWRTQSAAHPWLEWQLRADVNTNQAPLNTAPSNEATDKKYIHT